MNIHFRSKRTSPTVGVKKTKRIALSCGMKISAVGYFVVSQSQSTRVTDGQTELRQLYRASMRCMRRAVNVEVCSRIYHR